MSSWRLTIAAGLVGIALAGAAARLAPQGLRSAQFVLIARDGTRTVLGDTPIDTFSPRLSPDGMQVAFESRGAVWIAKLSDLGSRRQFSAPPNASFAVWRDAASLLFIGNRGGPSLYSAATDATGGAERLVEVARAPDGWSPVNNGASFITLKGDDYDIWFYSASSKQVMPLVVIPASRQLSSQISPDGKWLAYKSDETGSFEVWVQPFPSGPRTRVTTGGGRNPHWSADGRELFFDDDNQIFAVAVTSESPFGVGRPRPLPVTGFVQAGSLRRQWDVAPDGKFLVVVR